MAQCEEQHSSWEAWAPPPGPQRDGGGAGAEKKRGEGKGGTEKTGSILASFSFVVLKH